MDVDNGGVFDLDEECGMEFITMSDSETGALTEMCVIDKLEYGGCDYYLVFEAGLLEDGDESLNEEDEPDAVILKEVPDGNGDFVYMYIEEDSEFDTVAELFRKGSGDGYELRF